MLKRVEVGSFVFVSHVIINARPSVFAQSSFSFQLRFNELTVRDSVLDVHDFESWIRCRQLRYSNCLELVSVSIDVNDGQLVELAPHLGLASISADEDKGNVLALELESSGKVIGYKTVLRTVVKHRVDQS